MTVAPTRVVARPELCRGCQVCTLACSLDHEGECRPSAARLRVVAHLAEHAFEVTICQHCDDPACLAACPAEALVLREGVVGLEAGLCVVCGACATACPHDAVFYHEGLGRYLKCDLCAERASGPLCVELCPVGALALVRPAEQAGC